jgi:ribosome biogenesis GTPase
MTLEDLGWNAAFEKEFAPFRKNGWVPARLIRDNKITYGALMKDGDEEEVLMSGKVYHDARTDADLPAVGDWVALELGGPDEDTMIRYRMKRQTCFSRKMPGKSTEEQVIAANVNVVVVVTDAGPDYNPRRMERYFTIIGRSRAKPVVLVNKSDLFPPEQNEKAAAAIRALCDDADVYITSATKNEGLEVLKKYLKQGVALTLVGSSGVGKSSLINQLMGEEWQWVNEVNEVTGKGRHTTTARELIVLDEGGILIDNPGIREVQMWTDEITLRERFVDIEGLARRCKFSTCKHGSDAGCAIRAAVESGELEQARFSGFMKLDEEIEALNKRLKKREINVARRAKRDKKVKARNLADRIDVDNSMRARQVED